MAQSVDAPYGYQIKLWKSLRNLGFVQSRMDPCIWICYQHCDSSWTDVKCWAIVTPGGESVVEVGPPLSGNGPEWHNILRFEVVNAQKSVLLFAENLTPTNRMPVRSWTVQVPDKARTVIKVFFRHVPLPREGHLQTMLSDLPPTQERFLHPELPDEGTLRPTSAVDVGITHNRKAVDQLKQLGAKNLQDKNLDQAVSRQEMASMLMECGLVTPAGCRIAGVAGFFVGDSLSAGSEHFYHLLEQLTQKWSMGSFTQLAVWNKDDYLGGSLACIPESSVKRQLNEKVREFRRNMTDEELLQWPEHCALGPDLPQDDPAYTGIKDQRLSPARSSDKFKFPSQEELAIVSPVTFAISQETYISRIEILTRGEVEEYFQQRSALLRRGNRFALSRLKSPYRRVCGELNYAVRCAWVSKGAVSMVSSHSNRFELGETWEEVRELVEELNAVVLFMKFSDVQTRYIFEVRDPFILGVSDASLDRLAFSLGLACSARVGVVSQVTVASKEPHRVHSSSTGTEVLAVGATAAQGVQMRQLGLEVGIVGTSPVLILTDAKNAQSRESRPLDKNLARDLRGLALLRNADLLRLMHISGIRNPIDALTKALCDTNSITLLSMLCLFFPKETLGILHTFSQQFWTPAELTADQKKTPRDETELSLGLRSETPAPHSAETILPAVPDDIVTEFDNEMKSCRHTSRTDSGIKCLRTLNMHCANQILTMVVPPSASSSLRTPEEIIKKAWSRVRGRKTFATTDLGVERVIDCKIIDSETPSLFFIVNAIGISATR